MREGKKVQREGRGKGKRKEGRKERSGGMQRHDLFVFLEWHSYIFWITNHDSFTENGISQTYKRILILNKNLITNFQCILDNKLAQYF